MHLVTLLLLLVLVICLCFLSYFVDHYKFRFISVTDHFKEPAFGFCNFAIAFISPGVDYFLPHFCLTVILLFLVSLMKVRTFLTDIKAFSFPNISIHCYEFPSKHYITKVSQIMVYCVFLAFSDTWALFGHLPMICCLAVGCAAVCYLYKGFSCVSSWCPDPPRDVDFSPPWLGEDSSRPYPTWPLVCPFRCLPQSSPFPGMRCSPSLWAWGSGNCSAHLLTPWDKGSPTHSSIQTPNSQLSGITALCVDSTCCPVVGTLPTPWRVRLWCSPHEPPFLKQMAILDCLCPKPDNSDLIHSIQFHGCQEGEAWALCQSLHRSWEQSQDLPCTVPKERDTS